MNASPLYATVNGIRIAYERTGQGYPLLLLHGFPRNRRMWSRVTPALASRFTVVAMDLRGYGDSDRPPDEASYDKPTMAQDVLELARHLGWEKFLVVGHDRGASVTRRLAADHPEALSGAMILDIMPAEWSYRHQNPEAARRTWHHFFFLQRGVAEPLINQNPRLFFTLFVARNPHLPQEEQEYYIDLFCRPGAVEAVLADYRTGADVDRPRWEEEIAAGRKIRTPLYIIWGEQGPMARAPALEVWRQVAEDVRGEGVPDSAHYIPEQQPEAVVRHIIQFADELGLP